MTSTTHYEYETSLAAVGRTELVRRLVLARGRVQTLSDEVAKAAKERSRLLRQLAKTSRAAKAPPPTPPPPPPAAKMLPRTEMSLIDIARTIADNEPLLAPQSFTAMQMAVFLVVEASDGDPTVAEISDILGVSVSIVSPTMTALEKRGLVDLAHRSDRRMRHAVVTGKGKDALANARINRRKPPDPASQRHEK